MQKKKGLKAIFKLSGNRINALKKQNEKLKEYFKM